MTLSWQATTVGTLTSSTDAQDAYLHPPPAGISVYQRCTGNPVSVVGPNNLELGLNLGKSAK